MAGWATRTNCGVECHHASGLGACVQGGDWSHHARARRGTSNPPPAPHRALTAPRAQQGRTALRLHQSRCAGHTPTRPRPHPEAAAACWSLRHCESDCLCIDGLLCASGGAERHAHSHRHHRQRDFGPDGWCPCVCVCVCADFDGVREKRTEGHQTTPNHDIHSSLRCLVAGAGPRLWRESRRKDPPLDAGRQRRCRRRRRRRWERRHGHIWL